MRKPQCFYSRSSQNIPHNHPSSSTNQLAASKATRYEGIDLKRFNEYLENKISNKMYKKVARESKRQHTQTESNIMGDGQNQREGRWRPPSANKSRQQLLNRQSSNNLQNKVSWRRHQSIQRLLDKEKQNMRRQQTKQTQINQSIHLDLLQRRYRDLQQKYKKLMEETMIQVKQYEQSQKELYKLKVIHSEDQVILAQLQQQIMGIPKKKETSQNGCLRGEEREIKSQLIIESDVSLLSSEVMRRKSRQRESEQKQNFKIIANKTSQQWKVKDKSNNFQGYSRVRNVEQYDRRNQAQNDRYYSSQKVKNTQRNSKARHNDEVHYSQSKKQIRLDQQLSTSKVKASKQIASRHEPQKIITPTTLQKKVISNNQFSKYRFQPTVRLN